LTTRCGASPKVCAFDGGIGQAIDIIVGGASSLFLWGFLGSARRRTFENRSESLQNGQKPGEVRQKSLK
jgi:hypothetical protein